MIALRVPETELDQENSEDGEDRSQKSASERGVSEEKGEKEKKGEVNTKSPISSAVKASKKGVDEEKNGKTEEKKEFNKEDTKGEKKEEKEEDEDEEEEEEKERVVLRLDRSLTWFQPPVPQNRAFYTPVNLGPLLTAASSDSASVTTSATTSATSTASDATAVSSSSSELCTERYDSAAVRDILGGSVDAVRNEVLEVLTRTIYAVARSMRPDAVSTVLCRTLYCIMHCTVLCTEVLCCADFSPSAIFF